MIAICMGREWSRTEKAISLRRFSPDIKRLAIKLMRIIVASRGNAQTEQDYCRYNRNSKSAHDNRNGLVNRIQGGS